MVVKTVCAYSVKVVKIINYLGFPFSNYIKVHLEVSGENGFNNEEPQSLQLCFIKVEQKVVLWHCIE